MLFLDDGDLDRLHPWRLLLSADGVIEAVGPAIAHFAQRPLVGERFDAHFDIEHDLRTAHATVVARAPEVVRLSGVLLETGGGRRHLLLHAPLDAATPSANMGDTRRLAEAASQAKSRFLASMSHELRTPLNAIIGFTEIVIEDLAAAGIDRSNDDLRRVLRAATHLMGLVNNVLDLARIEAGKMPLRLDPVHYGDLAREIAATLEPLVRKNRNLLATFVGAEVGEGVSDPRRLRQCLINLLGNAAKFTQDGEVRLTVRRQDECIVFVVADTGMGMTEEEIAELFKPFVHAAIGPSGAHAGTGLGLAITRESARLLGGTLAVQSTPGVGSAFTLRVPCVVSAPSVQSAAA